MSTPATPTSFEPQRGGHGSNCPQCGAALASDQRYCLSCGRRLTDPRVDYRRALALGDDPGAPAPERPSQRDTRGPLLLLGAIATILLALGVGIVIGRGNGSAGSTTKPTVVTVAGGTAAPAASSASGTGNGAAAADTGSVTDQWPAGASGWTVELSSLDNAAARSADVSAAERAATSKGASAVGVLNGDQHGGTPTGKYVIYSGRFTSKQQAQTARAKLLKNFPGALVLHVTRKGSGSGSSANAAASTGPPSGSAGSSQAASERHLSGNAYEKASSKLPSSVGTGGAPPPTDKKKAGGGTSGSCIGC